jgi:DNA-binding GntR family transcriptional regulator
MSIAVPAYEQIRDIIREEIISGLISPGTHLTILSVANRFRVSQMPVREAFQWLQGEGVLKVHAHKGARVLALDINHIRNIYEICGVIEGLLARQSILQISDAILTKLNKINEQYREEIEKNNRARIRSVNKDFHKTIYQCSNNLEGLNIYERYEGLLASLRRKHGFRKELLQQAVEEHAQMLDALKSKDGRRAENLIRDHIAMALEEMLSFFQDDVEEKR